MTENPSGSRGAGDTSTARRPSSWARLPASMSWVPLLVVSVVAALWLGGLTERGIGAGSDSTVYVAGAQSLLHGQGFVWFGADQRPRPINHYPPLYSAALSMAMRADASPWDAARWVELLVFAA